MEKRWLKDYVYNLGKIERAMVRRCGLRIETDVVKGSSAEPPYTAHAMRVTGVNAVEVDRLSREIAETAAKCRAVEAFVDAIEDDQTRDIIRARYIDGDSWEDINEMYTGGEKHRDTPRKTAERYIKKIFG